MPETRVTPQLLWKLPRVGSPVPDGKGRRFVVPVTSYDIEKNEGLTRLWLGEGGNLRAMTADASSYSPAFSPDGRYLVFVRKAAKDDKAPGSEKSQLWLMPLDGGEPEKLTDMPMGAADPHWFPDGKRIAFLSAVYAGHEDLPATAAEAKRRKDSKVKAYATENRLYRYWDHWISDDPYQHIFVLDLSTRELKDLTPKLQRIFPLMELGGSWDISPNGDEVAFSANRTDPPYHEMFSGIYRLKLDGSEPRCISDWTGGSAQRPRFSPDGRWILYGEQEDEAFYADKVRLVAHDRATDKHTVLTEQWDQSAAEWEFIDKDTVVFTAEHRGANAVYTLAFDRAVASPGEVEPRRVVRGGWFAGIRPAGGQVFTTRQDLSTPGEVATLTLDGKVAMHSEFCRAQMAEVEQAKVEEVYFEGAEGKQVQMWLLYPPDAADRKRLPLLHLIHGGPHGVFGDSWHWRWCAQAFAAQGYLVALVNFHGSTSWGNEFARCIMGEWGKKPYEDIEKATDWLIEKGLADPENMACAGGSYGGYLVAWIAGQTDRYKCLVNHAGVSDLQSQFARDVTPGREKALGGEPWGDREGMNRYNPIVHSRNYKTPMLIIHGEQDYRVPYTQALETYNAYRAQGRDARLVVYPDENHWVLKPQNNLHWYGEVFAWLKRWI